MNLSPDPQLASSTMDYDALLLKETKTHNENVELKSISYNLAEDVRKLVEENEEHVAEIDKLKEEVKEHKEENEKWEADDEGLTKVMSMVSKELGDDEEPWEAVDDIYDIVKKLKKDNDEIDKLKAQVEGLRGSLKNCHEMRSLEDKTFKDAVVEALGGPEFNGPYKDCIRLRDITCEIGGLKEQVDRLREKLDIASKEHLACLDKINTFYEKKEKDWEEKVKDLKLQMKHEDGHTPDWAYEVGDYIREIEYLKEENKTLKDVMENQQSIREEYEKEMRDIKIAMGCDGPLSWDISDILKWIDRAKCYTGGPTPSEADADYERLVDKNNNDNLNFGDILFEREEEIKRLTKTLQLAEDKIKDLEGEEFCADCDKPHKCEDCVEDDAVREKVYSVSEMKNKIEKDTGLKLDNSFEVVEDDDCQPDAWDAM